MNVGGSKRIPPPPPRPSAWSNPGITLNGGRLCFCGVWVAAQAWHRLLTGHRFLAASDAQFTPEDHYRSQPTFLTLPALLTESEAADIEARWLAQHRGKGGAS
jgi:hypothetical protein